MFFSVTYYFHLLRLRILAFILARQRRHFSGVSVVERHEHHQLELVRVCAVLLGFFFNAGTTPDGC